MGGVIDGKGVQWEHCNGCGKMVKLSELEYEQPSKENPHGRDLCKDCMKKPLTHEEFEAAMLIMRAKDYFDNIAFFGGHREGMREMTYDKYLAVRARLDASKGSYKCVCWEDHTHTTEYIADYVVLVVNCFTGEEDIDSRGDEHGRCRVNP